MKVKLASCGNPGHFQDPDLPMYGCECDKIITVSSVEEASEKCRIFIERNCLGSGNWAGGEVYEGEKCMAKISYNGRILYD